VQRQSPWPPHGHRDRDRERGRSTYDEVKDVVSGFKRDPQRRAHQQTVAERAEYPSVPYPTAIAPVNSFAGQARLAIHP
jgi:hypothetical protein